MNMQPTILHLDLDAFFCAVEELHDPSLQGKAFAVGGSPTGRGVVSSCSYPARAMGVHSAMPMSQAVRLCPGLIVVSHGHGRYGEMSRQVMDRLRDLAPMVEQISVDEAFVDISDLRQDPAQIAAALQARISDELRLPCSVGVASNKLVAKIATEVGKHNAKKKDGILTYPNAITVVPAGQEAAFLRPLPANMLWGVGPKTEKRLAELGIKTIGQLADLGEATLATLFGEHGRDLARHALGIDNRPVSDERTVKSVSQERTYAQDVLDETTLLKTLKKLAAEVGRNLRQDDLAGTTIRLKLRWPDFKTISRQLSLPQPTNLDTEIYQHGASLLQAARAANPGRAIRLIGVAVSNLGPPSRQLELFSQQGEKDARLQKALDEIQARYGRQSIERGKGY